MKPCPFCAELIQDEAIKCRYCGEFLDGRPVAAAAMAELAGLYAHALGYEYRSPIEVFGLPLIHVARGYDPRTGAPRVARGIIAIGNIAIGLVAFGGLAIGGFAFGGLAAGVLAFGGLAAGVAVFGGGAVGLLVAIGGAAVSLGFALGGLAIAPYALGGDVIQIEGLRWLLPRLPRGF